MKQVLKLSVLPVVILSFFFTSCSSNQTTETSKTDSVEANIKMYTHTWDEIINHGKLDMFNDSNFTTDVVMHTHPDITGIDSARSYYTNYITGFSNIQFIIKDVFSQGNKLVKHWEFKGKHTGTFFGIPATGKDVDLEGVTLVKCVAEKLQKKKIFLIT